ncbi:MAG: hypothetical protein HQL13_08185, partial [Candidatus Omnitrophica bacterium]|nr:hypothetical protein [Candidatus Omnitrophota bacterium]
DKEYRVNPGIHIFGAENTFWGAGVEFGPGGTAKPLSYDGRASTYWNKTAVRSSSFTDLEHSIVTALTRLKAGDIAYNGQISGWTVSGKEGDGGFSLDKQYTSRSQVVLFGSDRVVHDTQKISAEHIISGITNNFVDVLTVSGGIVHAGSPGTHIPSPEELSGKQAINHKLVKDSMAALQATGASTPQTQTAQVADNVHAGVQGQTRGTPPREVKDNSSAPSHNQLLPMDNQTVDQVGVVSYDMGVNPNRLIARVTVDSHAGAGLSMAPLFENVYLKPINHPLTNLTIGIEAGDWHNGQFVPRKTITIRRDNGQAIGINQTFGVDSHSAALADGVVYLSAIREHFNPQDTERITSYLTVNNFAERFSDGSLRLKSQLQTSDIARIAENIGVDGTRLSAVFSNPATAYNGLDIRTYYTDMDVAGNFHAVTDNGNNLASGTGVLKNVNFSVVSDGLSNVFRGFNARSINFGRGDINVLIPDANRPAVRIDQRGIPLILASSTVPDAHINARLDAPPETQGQGKKKEENFEATNRAIILALDKSTTVVDSGYQVAGLSFNDFAQPIVTLTQDFSRVNLKVRPENEKDLPFVAYSYEQNRDGAITGVRELGGQG